MLRKSLGVAERSETKPDDSVHPLQYVYTSYMILLLLFSIIFWVAPIVISIMCLAVTFFPQWKNSFQPFAWAFIGITAGIWAFFRPVGELRTIEYFDGGPLERGLWYALVPILCLIWTILRRASSRS